MNEEDKDKVIDVVRNTSLALVEAVGFGHLATLIGSLGNSRKEKRLYKANRRFTRKT